MAASNGFLDKSRVEIKLGDYGVAPATALDDPGVLPRVQDYRRQTGSRMYPLDRDDISKKIPTADYHVSRKIDGEFTVLVYQDGQAYTVNPGGTVRVGMPWQAEAVELLKKHGVKQAMIAGELYVAETEGRRPRVHDVTHVARQPESAAELERLGFAVFDVISLDGESAGGDFIETWKTIEKTFDGGRRVHPVEFVWAKDVQDIQKQFQKWVDDEGAEGLVVRSDTAGLFKIKPRHTIDAVVIGFTESADERQGMMHDLLLALMRKDKTLHVLCRVGGGFSEDVRREMLSDLKDMIVESEYAEVNSDHVAYQMVRPEWVIEISCLDMVSQTTRGGTVNRMALNWNESGGPKYEVIRRLPLVSVISPQFIRRREDKSVNPTDVRVQQIADIVEVPLIDRDASQMTLPKSEVLRREVYTKQLKGETMVRKFLVWKTNKEAEHEEYPAYVVHYTDFSPNRKTPLSREVRVSNSREQIDELLDKLKEANIKKGWELYSGIVDGGSEEAPKPKEDVTAKEPTKKKAAKKAAKKKATKEKATKEPEVSAKKKETPAKKKKAAKKKTKKKASKS